MFSHKNEPTVMQMVETEIKLIIDKQQQQRPTGKQKLPDDLYKAIIVEK